MREPQLSSEPQDLVVIGGGTAGLVAAVGAAGVGARVTLVEGERTGGDCLWTGCVPSKALLSAARAVYEARHADRFGLEAYELEVDMVRVMDTIRARQATIAPHDSPERLRREGVTVIHGRGCLLRRGVVGVTREDGTTLQLRTRTALVATGSRPAIPPIEGLDESHCLTTDNLWQLEELPRRLLVMGGGPIGSEMGQAFTRLGSTVTIVEQGPHLLPGEEPAASDAMTEALVAEGAYVRAGHRAVRVEEGPVRPVLRVETTDSRRQTARLPYDRLLIATGRRPATEGLGLEENGVALSQRGHVLVDDTMRTTADWVFAAGDVTGGMPFTHAAAAQGSLVVTNALFGLRRSFDPEVIPWAIFTEPEVGRVGLTEEQAVERHGRDAVTVARFEHQRLDRAVTGVELPTGFTKLVAGPRERLVGATVVSHSGGEVIGAATAWVREGAKLRDIAQVTMPYPTFVEGPVRAAGEVMRERFLSERTRRIAKPVLGVARAVRRPWSQ